MTAPNEKWLQDASYTYGTYAGTDKFTSLITFIFPNAATGPLEFTDWLYRFQNGQKTATNITAEMLMCMVDHYWRTNADA